MIDSGTFTWNGQAGTVLHECVRETQGADLLYYGPPPFDERGERVCCNQKNVLGIEFGDKNTVIEEFSIPKKRNCS